MTENLEKNAKNLLEEVEEQKISVYHHPGINQVPVNANLVSIDNKSLKIGEYVQRTFAEVIDFCLLSNREILNLQSLEWCKKTFKLNHPFLKHVDLTLDVQMQRKDNRGHLRYYQKIYTIKGNSYLLCKEWYEERRPLYEKWLKQYIDENRAEKIVKLLKFIASEDTRKTYVRTHEIIRKFNNIPAIDLLLELLVNIGVLSKFNNDTTKLVVDDYEHLYRLTNDKKSIYKELKV